MSRRTTSDSGFGCGSTTLLTNAISDDGKRGKNFSNILCLVYGCRSFAGGWSTYARWPLRRKKLIRDAIVDKLMVGTKYRTQRMAYVNWLHYLLMMKDRRRRQRLANSLIVSSVFLKRQWAYRKWQEYLALRRKRKALSKAMSAMLSITDN
eukprot:PhF_6_TR42705/c0_g1_i2/m.64505